MDNENINDFAIEVNLREIANQLSALSEQVFRLRPYAEWTEEIGPVLWWSFPIIEPPYCGTPLDSDFPWRADGSGLPWPTHFTLLPNTAELQRRFRAESPARTEAVRRGTS